MVCVLLFIPDTCYFSAFFLVVSFMPDFPGSLVSFMPDFPGSLVPGFFYASLSWFPGSSFLFCLTFLVPWFLVSFLSDFPGFLVPGFFYA
jgi:hypothetical protein